MSLLTLSGRSDYKLAIDSVTRQLHLVQVEGGGAVTDLGAIAFNIGATAEISGELTDVANPQTAAGDGTGDKPGVMLDHIRSRIGATNGAKATVDGDGTVIQQLRRVTFEADRAADVLENVQHAEDEAYTATDNGIPPLAVRKDTRAQAGAAADGDYIPLQATATGDLRTRDDDMNTAVGGTAATKADVDGNGSVIGHLRRIGFEADRIGDALESAIKAEDTAAGAADKGICALAVRTDARAALVGDTNDLTQLQTTANGDLRIRDDDANTALTALTAAVKPTAITPMAAVTTTTAAWDSGGANEIAIPANSQYCDVYVSADAYLVASASANDPAQNGARYVGGATYQIRCFGMSYLHIKRVSGDVTVEATFFGA